MNTEHEEENSPNPGNFLKLNNKNEENKEKSGCC